jgi:hypothetical protein
MLKRCGILLLLTLFLPLGCPSEPPVPVGPPRGIKEILTPDNLQIMAEHLRREHGLKAKVLCGSQVMNGSFVWQDLTCELIDYPGFVFSYPHYLGNLYSQEALRETE